MPGLTRWARCTVIRYLTIILSGLSLISSEAQHIFMSLMQSLCLLGRHTHFNLCPLYFFLCVCVCVCFLHGAAQAVSVFRTRVLRGYLGLQRLFAILSVICSCGIPCAVQILLRLSRSCFGEGDGTPLHYSCLENPLDGGAWWAAVHGVASWTRLSEFTFTFHFHALEKEMATHSSVLAWRIPGTGKPGGLPSLGSHRVRHD